MSDAPRPGLALLAAGLIDAARQVDEGRRREIATDLLERWAGDGPADWRTWSVARGRARALVKAVEPELRAMAAGARP